MIYTVENKKTHKQYDVDESTYKTLDKRFKLISSWDEKAKTKAPIPEEIVIKSTKPIKKAENKNDISND